MRVCNVPGCPTITDQPRCPEHRIPDQRGSRGYSTAAWQRARAAYLKAHPYCEHVIAYRGDSYVELFCKARATEVDHIDGLGPRGPHATDPTNLRAYCKHHHSQRTGRDHQPGSRLARGVR